MKKDFLLTSPIARCLYDFVKDLPIVDYHNHLSVEDIARNTRFWDIFELWIKPDPYKHRAMRMCGVEEQYITGDATGEEKFVKWCETVPRLLGNPLYHWTAMELHLVFGIDEMPNGQNAKSIYDRCNDYLKKHDVSVATLMKRFRVEQACPCVSLTDDVTLFKNDPCFSPSLRGDDMVDLTADFVHKLEGRVKTAIPDMQTLRRVIGGRLEELKIVGCRFSDHALDNGFTFFGDDGKNDERYRQLLSGTISPEDKQRLSSYMLSFLGEEYATRGFVMQLHIGAQRYTSSRLRKAVGPAGGFAGIGNSVNVASLTDFLDTLDSKESGLPKTVLFTLNPADNPLLSVLSGSYSQDGTAGLITQGPAWWWCDHKRGITDMLEDTAAFSVLSNFIGMTTDSRSFLSFARHDYFRRILCDWIGKKADSGEWDCGMHELEKLVGRLCYENAKNIMK